MKIATWNVNSILARLPVVLRWLDQAQPDVLCMQETKCTDDKFPVLDFSALGYRAELFGQATYNGVAVLSKIAATDVQRGMHDDEEGAQSRLLAVTVQDIRVVNVYVPNGQAVGTDKYQFKLGWLKRLRSFFDTHYHTNEQVLLCGDFNVAPEDRDVHSPDLWRGRILFSDPEKEALDRVKQWGFVDAFRMHNSGDKEFSWWDYRAGGFRRNLGLRIDHIWVTSLLADRCRSVTIDKEPRRWEKPSDHAPVIAEFQ